MLSFDDVNEYVSAQATGGTYLNSPATGSEVVRPAPYLTLGSTATNSGGIYNNTVAVTSILSGTYVKITDTCGAISRRPTARQRRLRHLHGHRLHDAGPRRRGQHPLFPRAVYQVNRIKEVVRGWLPSNTSINGQVNINVNLNQTCNAYWDGTALNFFKSGGGCANTGQIAGVFAARIRPRHRPERRDRTPSTAHRRVLRRHQALIALHDYCLGEGFLAATAPLTATPEPPAPASVTPTTPSTPRTPRRRRTASSASTARRLPAAPALRKEVHCESYVPTETMWFLAVRDPPSLGTGCRLDDP